jgi:outer membrane lipoprotein-sorting protein
MTETRLWDRAAAVPAVVDGRRLPQVAALPDDRPSVAELFEFMRDAESRFATLRMRVVERSNTARGEERATIDLTLRHPGDARVTTSRDGTTAKGEYEVWISDGDLVRRIRDPPGRSGRCQAGRGLEDRDFPASTCTSRRRADRDPAGRSSTPAGYCQNVLATGRCMVSGSAVVNDREAILLECDHPRTTELAGDRPDLHISLAVDRETGVILRLVETIGGLTTRQADVVDLVPDAPLPPRSFDFVFPTGTTLLY